MIQTLRTVKLMPGVILITPAQSALTAQHMQHSFQSIFKSVLINRRREEESKVKHVNSITTLKVRTLLTTLTTLTPERGEREEGNLFNEVFKVRSGQG